MDRELLKVIMEMFLLENFMLGKEKKEDSPMQIPKILILVFLKIIS
jgi:hypothetical protein